MGLHFFRDGVRVVSSDVHVPPHDFGAERAVLSTMLMDEERRDLVFEMLIAEHFYDPRNRLLFGAMKDLTENGKAIDAVAVVSWLRDRELSQRAGGPKYLGEEILSDTPFVANVEEHAKQVRDKWRLFQAIKIQQRGASEAYGSVGDVQVYLDQLEQKLGELSYEAKVSDPEPVRDVLSVSFKKLAEAAESEGNITGIPTRFIDLDKKTAGLHRGDLMIIAGRPSMGKSSLALNLAVNVASPEVKDGEDDGSGDGVAVFSLEMPKDQIAQKLACSEGRVDLGRLRSGHLTQEDWGDLTAAARYLAPLPIFIDDTAAIGLLELRGKVRRIRAALKKRDVQLGVVIIDYLQLMSGRGQNREDVVATLSRGLKQLAKEMDVAVIALSQLNRGVETRGGKDKRPMLSDLRESGAIEQDADVIIFIYRDEYYNKETNERGIAELIIAKQRNGPTGTVRTRFIGPCTRFESLAPGEYEEFGELGG